MRNRTYIRDQKQILTSLANKSPKYKVICDFLEWLRSLELLLYKSNSLKQYIYSSTTASIYSSVGGIGTELVAGVFAKATTSSLD